MARRKSEQVSNKGRTEHIVSTAVGAAEALSVGVLHLTETTVVEALRAVQDIGRELGSAVVRTARGSIKAAEDIGSDLVMVGKGVSHGVGQPAREVGNDIRRLASGLWGRAPRGPRGGRAKTAVAARKMPAKASGRRRRRSAA
jgi:hypothetical protein